MLDCGWNGADQGRHLPGDELRHFLPTAPGVR